MSLFGDAWGWLAVEVNDLAIQKGWWEGKRSFLECMGLVISELGEAVEAFRTPRCSSKILAHSHAAEELADVVIRLADLSHHFGIDVPAAPWFDRMAHLFDNCNIGDPKDNFVCCIDALMDLDLGCCDYNPIEYIAIIAGELGEGILSYTFEEDNDLAAETIACAFLTICQVAHTDGIDLGEAILAKHAYNQSRSYRHGDKRY